MSKVVNIESDNEDFVEVEFSNEVLASAEKIERKCYERLDGQRADFPRVYGETDFSQTFYEDRVSSRSYAEDKVSSNSPLIFCKPGKARKWYSELLCPLHGVK